MKYIARIWMVAAAALIAVVVVLGAVWSQHEPAPRPVTRVAEPGDLPGNPGEVIDQELMIALAQAKNFHHKAKVYMSDGNVAAATLSVRQILSLRFPAAAAEADDVRNDARALLAKLLLGQGHIDEATRTIDEGLAASPRESFFVANLYTVQGEIHEARAAALDATGEPARPAAAAARRAAIGSYDRSIQINERLQKKLMEER
jgi:tetratricopeptide (TPR) repeat protein